MNKICCFLCSFPRQQERDEQVSSSRDTRNLEGNLAFNESHHEHNSRNIYFSDAISLSEMIFVDPDCLKARNLLNKVEALIDNDKGKCKSKDFVHLNTRSKIDVIYFGIKAYERIAHFKVETTQEEERRALIKKNLRHYLSYIITKFKIKDSDPQYSYLKLKFGFLQKKYDIKFFGGSNNDEEWKFISAKLSLLPLN